LDPRLLFPIDQLSTNNNAHHINKPKSWIRNGKVGLSNIKIGLYRQTGPAQIRGNKKIPHWVKMATFVDIFFETRDTPALIA
jgi:hypothetical protein